MKKFLYEKSSTQKVTLGSLRHRVPILDGELWSPLPWFKHLWRKMDVSTLGSLRHRVPILDGEYFHE